MKKTLFFKVFLSVLFLFGVSSLLLTRAGGIEYFFSYGLYPFLELQRTLVSRIEHWFKGRTSYDELVIKLASEEHRVLELQKELIEARSAAHYCQTTTDLREFLDRYSLKDAHITFIALKHFDRSHFYLVDKGAHAGIKKNMIAVYKDCLVGRVTEVYPLYSKIMLITDPLCKVASFCSTTGAKGVFEGQGSMKSGLLSYVSSLDEVKIGDMILSSGEGLIFPRGFAIGRIASIEHEGHQSVVQVGLLLEYSSLEYCALIPHDSSLIELATQDSG